VDELLRFEPPSPVQGRRTTHIVTVRGVDIPANSKVLLLTGSAGRDPRAYDDPVNDADVERVHTSTVRGYAAVPISV
jgi:cytochrome P450